MTIGLIDGDIILFRAAASCEKETTFDGENYLIHSNLTEVKDHIRTAMKAIHEDLGLSDMWVAFTGTGNFRKSMLTDTYKSNRKGLRKPLCYGPARSWMFDNWTCSSRDGLEGDDLLGIWQTRSEPGSTIIVSADKDMKTIPGKHAKFDNLGGVWVETVKVSEDEANYFWMTQTLVGDTADGYKGLPGCGPVKAEKILDCPDKDNMPRTLGELWDRVVTAYKAAGLSVEDAILQARLARILRAEDWDSEKKEVKLWTPK